MMSQPAPSQLPSPSRSIAEIEAEIAQTRHKLDEALLDLRTDLAVPLALLRYAAPLGTGERPRDAVRARRGAMPLTMLVLGAAWLGIEKRKTLGDTLRPLRVQMGDIAMRLGAAVLSVLHDKAVSKDGPTVPPS